MYKTEYLMARLDPKALYTRKSFRVFFTMSTNFSPFHQQDGDACRWITPREFRDVEDHIREREFPTESELHAVYIDVRDALDYGNINFAVVGGYAMNAYGITRQTRDVDFYFNAADEEIFGVLRALPL
jgi:hypothetical protein